MKSNAQTSFSSRLTNAETLVENLETFTDFNPQDDTLLAASVKEDTINLHAIQKDYAKKQFEYTQATIERKKFFESEPNSITKVLSPISSYIAGKFGKESAEFKRVKAEIDKIRGVKKVKITENSNEKTISRSERSFGNRLVYFGDIITVLETNIPSYAPPREAIKIDNLKIILDKATGYTNVVSNKLALFKPVIQSRTENYKKLNKKAQRIKNLVKSQYGIESAEYKLIKGLVI